LTNQLFSVKLKKSFSFLENLFFLVVPLLKSECGMYIMLKHQKNSDVNILQHEKIYYWIVRFIEMSFRKIYSMYFWNVWPICSDKRKRISAIHVGEKVHNFAAAHAIEIDILILFNPMW